MRAWMVGVVVLVCAGARAKEPDALAAAKAHFKAGQALYQAGEYEDALREWSSGYELAPRPEFLLNLGQAYRKMKRWDKAAEYFRRYLASTAADDARRAEVQTLLADLPAATAPPTTVAPRAQIVAPIVAAPPPPRLRRARVWIPVGIGAAAIVAGVAIGVGVYYGTHPGNRFDCGGAIGCIDAARAQ